MRILFLCFLSLCATGQDDIQSILERNPFDPDRGQKEDTQEEAVEEEIVEPTDLPILDGTIIVGSTRIALLSYSKEGKPVSARVVMKENQSGYILYERGPKDPDEEEASPSFLGQRDGRVAGYLVQRIERGLVELQGREPVPPLKLYSGKKENRGGSKKVEPARGRKSDEPKTLGVAKEEQKKPTTSLVRTKDGEKKPRFTKRTRPNIPSSPAANSKKESLKKKM